MSKNSLVKFVPGTGNDRIFCLYAAGGSLHHLKYNEEHKHIFGKKNKHSNSINTECSVCSMILDPCSFVSDSLSKEENEEEEETDLTDIFPFDLVNKSSDINANKENRIIVYFENTMYLKEKVVINLEKEKKILREYIKFSILLMIYTSILFL